MELDLSEIRLPLIAVVVLLLLVTLGWLGRLYSPAGDVPLTWSEWQVLKARSAYLKQLSTLQAAADDLVSLLNAQPDPVRAQLTATRIQRLASEGQPALAYQRQKLTLAAQTVSDWAVGAIDHETARQALEQALQALSSLPTSSPTPVPKSYLPGLIFLPQEKSI